VDEHATDLGPITQILVPVADVDRAAAFYQDVLGLPMLFRYPGNAFFDAHGVRL
jgi:catechol 2,3-dioxygenase-like lactoylglutathione lyase family enzyme